MPDMMPKRFYTPEEVANLTGVSTKTLSRWRKIGKGPVYQQYMRGGAIRYPVAETLEWLQTHTNHNN